MVSGHRLDGRAHRVRHEGPYVFTGHETGLHVELHELELPVGP